MTNKRRPSPVMKQVLDMATSIKIENLVEAAAPDKLRPLHAIKQADLALDIGGMREDNIFRKELRTAHDVLQTLIEGARELKASRPAHMCYRNKRERRAYELLEQMLAFIENED